MKRVVLTLALTLVAFGASRVVLAQEEQDEQYFGSCPVMAIVKYNTDGTVNCRCRCWDLLGLCC